MKYIEGNFVSYQGFPYYVSNILDDDLRFDYIISNDHGYKYVKESEITPYIEVGTLLKSVTHNGHPIELLHYKISDTNTVIYDGHVIADKVSYKEALLKLLDKLNE